MTAAPQGVRTLDAPLLSAWQTHQRAQSLSERTIEERVRTVTQLALACRKDAHAPSVDDIAGWLSDGGEWTATTRWTYHVQLNAWFTWLQVQGHRDDNPMLLIGKPRRPRADRSPGAAGARKIGA